MHVAGRHFRQQRLMALHAQTVGGFLQLQFVTEPMALVARFAVVLAKGVMLDEGHLRLPVFEETLDRIVGILMARDLWRADREGKTWIKDVFRPAPFAPATKPVDDLIGEMRTNRVKMVIVVDEFGGTAGLYTLGGQWRVCSRVFSTTSWRSLSENGFSKNARPQSLRNSAVLSSSGSKGMLIDCGM